jgi:hypothetical protein
MMKEPVVVAPKFWSFSSQIFSQASQNVTVKLRVDHSVRRNKFMVTVPFTSKKTMSMLSLLNSGPAAPFLLLVIVGFYTAMIVALFLDHNHKSNFNHPYDSRDKSWVLVSLLS